MSSRKGNLYKKGAFLYHQQLIYMYKAAIYSLEILFTTITIFSVECFSTLDKEHLVEWWGWSEEIRLWSKTLIMSLLSLGHSTSSINLSILTPTASWWDEIISLMARTWTSIDLTAPLVTSLSRPVRPTLSLELAKSFLPGTSQCLSRE